MRLGSSDKLSLCPPDNSLLCFLWQMFPQIHGIRITLGSIVPDIFLFLGEVVHKDRVFVKHIIRDDKAMLGNGLKDGSEFIKHRVRITPMP